ncbi:transposase [Candidatus Dojkabacteria bacterium]|uniref:Transposase n=1 Tax=Candidatus Dojkabacteria bacterium TaxID=2099670 RepID=A0A955RLQ2_9BACT|nr:transposase [Candidatus Dojkabacteria bacterium]
MKIVLQYNECDSPSLYNSHMYKHRNSQKRIYSMSATYFITFCTKDRFPFFSPEEKHHKTFCELFINELILAKTLKKFDLFAFTIMYDHVHLLIKPGDQFNISECVHVIKRHFARDVNILLKNKEINLPEGEDRDPRLQINELILDNLGNKSLRIFPKFQWQRSFHDHLIRNEKDFIKHYNYITNNYLKHSAVFNYPLDWKYMYPNERIIYKDLITVYK